MSDNLQDASLMPYGKYKGFKMIDVPVDYLWSLSRCKGSSRKGVRHWILNKYWAEFNLTKA